MRVLFVVTHFFQGFLLLLRKPHLALARDYHVGLSEVVDCRLLDRHLVGHQSLHYHPHLLLLLEHRSLQQIVHLFGLLQLNVRMLDFV